MSSIILSEQSASPFTPAAGKIVAWADNTATPRMMMTDDQGVPYPVSTLVNMSTTQVSAAYASDTYIAGSSIQILAGTWRAKQVYKLTFDVTKTAAGTATPIITIRMGTLGTTSDASIVAFTFTAGTAVADSGVFSVLVGFRAVGASAVLAGRASLDHHLAATGLTALGAAGKAIVNNASAAFNSTTQTIIGASFNGGASFSGTTTLVEAELVG